MYREDIDADSRLQGEVDGLVGEWLPLPDVAEELGLRLSEVRRMISDNVIVAIRRGRPAVLSVPALLVRPEPLASFSGTWTLLHDCGFADLEALRWLFAEADGVRPIDLLRAGRKTEVRRLAQALAL